jgi:hypothetical protein
MTSARQIRSYDYVNHPYAQVRDALRHDAVGLFRAATRAASDRAAKVAASLRVEIAGIEVAKDIAIRVARVEEKTSKALAGPVTILHLEWEAAQSPRLFPLMRGELSVYALTATETQLDFHGHYEVPLGALGGMLDSIVGHRIAEASVHRFLSDTAAHLRERLPAR